MANLQKLVNLLKKTGDKAVVLDESGDPSYVIMTVSDYEELILGKSGVSGLTEEELLDKINRDITIWKDTQELKELSIDQYDFAKEIGDFSGLGNLPNLRENDWRDSAPSVDEDRYYFEPVEG